MSPFNDIVWPQAALDARESVKARIPESLRITLSYPPGSDVRAAAKDSGLLSSEELDLTDLTTDATAIVEAIKNKKYSAVQVITAFAKRAAIAHQLLNCLTDFFLDEALERAKELDEIYERTGSVVGPLHGLPISIKEQMGLKGHFSTGGFLSQYGKFKDETNGHLIDVLYDAGAVFYCKTNLPQSIMHLETNSFFGETLNPYNTNLTPGGSSGGCSALVSFGGSPLSLGTDIGGSLRSPAGATGLWTLKATTSRVPGEGGVKTMPGKDSVASTAGPICRSLRDIDLWFSVVIGSKPWYRDYKLVPLAWGTSSSVLAPTGSKRRIGVMWSDGVVTPQPPIQRALKTVVEALKKHGDFEIVDYVPYKHAELSDLVHELYFPDAGARIRELVEGSGEPLLPLTEWVITRPTVKDHTVHESWNMTFARETIRAEYLAHWNSQNIDFVLCPVGPGPAPKLQTAKYWGYTCAWNMVDYPAAVFPTGLFADPTLDNDPSYAQAKSLNEHDAYNRECYTPETFANAPLCLQLVGRRYADDQIVKALGDILKVLN